VDLRDTLAALQDARVVRASFSATGELLHVEFAPEPPGPLPATPFVDKDGKAVDFDADMPPLGRDMVAEANLARDKTAGS
jgi:hypothetical protein